MSESLQQLCSRIASGEPEALSRFYRERFEWMYGEVRRTTGRDESFCLDVVQDSMMKVIRSIRAYECQVQFDCWLRRVVRSCALDRMRAESRRLNREQAALDGRVAAGGASGELDERIDWLRRELRSMPPEQSALLDLRLGLGWTLARIGRLVGLSPGAVDGRVRRAVADLKGRGNEVFDD